MDNDKCNTSSIIACIFAAAVTFLQNLFLVAIGGIHIQIHRLMGGIYEVRY
jgi:hypothetical protein